MQGSLDYADETINATIALGAGLDGSGVGVAILDSGVTEAPDLTVTTPSAVWVRIAHGELDGGKALADGLYQVQGDFGILTRMKEWFAGG